MGIRRLGVNPPKMKRRAWAFSEDMLHMVNREYLGDLVLPWRHASSRRQHRIPVSANTQGGCGGCSSLGRLTFLRANRAKNFNLVRL